MSLLYQAKESVELALQLQGKKVQNREIRIKRIDTTTVKNQAFNKKPIPFKRTKPACTNSQNFQGEIMKSKTKNKVNILPPTLKCLTCFSNKWKSFDIYTNSSSIIVCTMYIMVNCVFANQKIIVLKKYQAYIYKKIPIPIFTL